MPNKYDKEIDKDQLLRDALILANITVIYEAIREKAQSISKSVTDKARKDQAYFNTNTNQVDFQTELSQAVRPDYVRRDAFSKKMYIQEYNTSYFQSKYSVENQGIAKGFDFDLPDYTDKQFQEARDYALSKLMNKSKMTTGRNLNIAQLEDIIVSGVNQGLSLKNINKNMDIALGFRDADGIWVDEIVDRKRQQYETQRILRTEILRMRSQAETDQWVNQQDIVPSKLQLIETLDNRTRRQSIRMDGQFADKNGKFLFPEVGRAFAHSSGLAKFDINDRSTTINVDPDYPQDTRIERDPETGRNEILPFRSAEDYRRAHNLTRNIYGEWLIEKPS
jgi:hypothetical protein